MVQLLLKKSTNFSFFSVFANQCNDIFCINIFIVFYKLIRGKSCASKFSRLFGYVWCVSRKFQFICFVWMCHKIISWLTQLCCLFVAKNNMTIKSQFWIFYLKICSFLNFKIHKSFGTVKSFEMTFQFIKTG